MNDAEMQALLSIGPKVKAKSQLIVNVRKEEFEKIQEALVEAGFTTWANETLAAQGKCSFAIHLGHGAFLNLVLETA